MGGRLAGKLTGLILAGGLGTRMRPFTLHTPKNLIEVEGRPFLDYQLELLAKNGVGHAVLSTGYLGHKIEDYLEANGTHGISVEVCHEKEQLGTGGAIVNALPSLPKEFLLIYGDSYLLQPFAPVHDAFAASGKDAMMVALEQKGGTTENNCELKGNLVSRYQKGQPQGTFTHMDYGLLFFKKKALEKYGLENFSTDRIFADLIAARQLAAFETRAPYYEVGSKEGLRNFTEYINSLGRR
jgi:N-acetyl-alpha-D-muramate 1-phosphate uridylyltransferase